MDNESPAVLMVSAFTDYSKEELIERGAIGLLIKPVDYEQLVFYIQKNLNLKRKDVFK